MPTIAEYLDECYREEFSRVVAAWAVDDVTRRVSEMGGYCDAKKDGVILRLLNDRGCISCEVAPDDRTEDFVDVELLVQVLDHLGKTGTPHWTKARRLSLADQCSFLIARKEEVVRGVSKPRWRETRDLATVVGRARFQRLVGKNG
jgi:hypothetical protein